MADTPVNEMSLDELMARRAYWQARIDAATSWRASIYFAASQRDQLDRAIARRRDANG